MEHSAKFNHVTNDIALDAKLAGNFACNGNLIFPHQRIRFNLQLTGKLLNTCKCTLSHFSKNIKKTVKKVKLFTLQPIYSLSPKIDALKIDAFSKNTRDSRKNPFMNVNLWMSIYECQFLHQAISRVRNWHAKDWRIFQVLNTIKMRQSLAKDCTSIEKVMPVGVLQAD